MATTSAAARQLSDGNSQGTILGQSSSDKISFYNVSSVARQGVGGATSFASLSLSSGALASSIALALHSLGLINCSSMAA